MEKRVTTPKGERKQEKRFKGGDKVIIAGYRAASDVGPVAEIKECDWGSTPQLFRVQTRPENKIDPGLQWFPWFALVKVEV